MGWFNDDVYIFISFNCLGSKWFLTREEDLGLEDLRKGIRKIIYEYQNKGLAPSKVSNLTKFKRTKLIDEQLKLKILWN